ncbi:MAG: hypothetical protein ACXU8N_10515 [Telluria sp.]
MKLTVLFVLAALAAGDAVASAAALRSRCEATPASSILNVHPATYAIDHSQSYRTLARMKQPLGARAYVLGLTRTESHVSIRSTGTLYTDPAEHLECIAPRVTVDLWYSPVTIYVGREFAPGSCSYRAILDHELRHYTTYERHLRTVEENVRAALQQRFSGRPLYAPQGQVHAQLAHEIDARWLPYIKSELGQVETLQAAIDSPAEYARLSKVCRGEVQSIIRSTRTRHP